jgi:hypothetical protein
MMFARGLYEGMGYVGVIFVVLALLAILMTRPAKPLVAPA